MKIKNILVTGSSGKVSRNLLPKLVKAGYSVRVIEFEEPIKCIGVEVITGNIRDPELAKRILPDMDAVIHLANVKENKELFMDSNIRGTFYLLDKSRENGHIKQFIRAGFDARAGSLMTN